MSQAWNVFLLTLILNALSAFSTECDGCGSSHLRSHRRLDHDHRRRRSDATANATANERCWDCCHDKKDYQVCGWCPGQNTCEKIRRDQSTCLVITSKSECWSASCPAAFSNYVGKIASKIKHERKAQVEKLPLVVPYPVYSDQTGIFDLSTGIPLASSSEGSKSQGVLIGAAGDWASGTCEAKTVANLIAQHEPQITIHLGDTYYVGDEEDFQLNVMGMTPKAAGQEGVRWPKGSHTTFLMAGNHEQIAGMNGLVKQGYGYSGQKTNYGAWFSDHWRFIALDTGYNCMGLYGKEGFRNSSIETDANLTIEQVEWLKNTVNLGNASDKRGIVLMTHHFPYSDFEKAYLGVAMQMQELLPKDRTVVWFFGHEHRFALYEKLKLQAEDFILHNKTAVNFTSDYDFYGRMVGNGGYRITPKKPKHHKSDLRLVAYDDRTYQKIPDDKGHKTQKLGYNGYFTVQVNGAELLVTYISAKCKGAGGLDCTEGYNLTHGEVQANETITVDLTTGNLTQQWLYVNDSMLTVSAEKSQSHLGRPIPKDPNPAHQGVEYNNENTGMD
mmetsp:Transcript_103134/g.126048  ORF Transcript_103134/g.126048 Transcript_103134/m.126048 type:complete len:557 (-) Transcript_103134:31-1701(-)